MRMSVAAASAVVAAIVVPGAAAAKVPVFAATCPTGITVETTAAGRATINGKTARVRNQNAEYAEISGAGVTVSVARSGNDLIVSYTGKGRANGICQVVRQDQPAAAAPAPAALRDPIPSRDRTACLNAVRKTTNNPQVVVLETVASEANNTVKVGVGPDRAPWRCLVKRGVVGDVMSLTNEGRL